MVRRWCIPVAALAIAGGLVLAASAASASTSHSVRSAAIQPGGLVSHLVEPFIGHGQNVAATSANWSGYAASGGNGSFKSVSANWTQPTGHCGSGNGYSSFWVGLDGFNSSTVEQTGSEVDCTGGSPQYYAWWEMYPGASHNFASPVAPGDHFSASVSYNGGSSYILKITDSTKGWSHTLNKSLSSAKRSSAEVIVEAPCCTGAGAILPLADFGKVNFTHSDVNGSPIGNSAPTRIVMKSGGTQKDSVTSLSKGTNFSATWLHR
jgi:hypothetical protein